MFSVVESDEDQAMACGGAALLRGIACWRYFTRNWDGLHALFLALTAGASHTGADAQANLNVVSVVTLLKVMRPPGRPDDPTSPAAKAAAAICEEAADAATGRKGGPPLPWRYAVASNCYPLLVLPALAPDAAGALVQHYTSILLSDVPISRQIGAGGLAVLLMPMWYPRFAELSSALPTTAMTPASVTAARDALGAILSSQAVQLLPTLVESLVNSHPMLSGGSDALRAGVMQQLKDDAIPKTLLGTLMRGDWPGGRSSIPAVSKGHFVVIHARLIEIFCMVAPETVMPALREPLEKILAKPQDSDRSAVAAAAEVLSGILASGKAFENGAWEDWVRPTLSRAMAAAPLELVDLWCAALRFALHELGGAGKQDLVATIVDSMVLQGTAHTGNGGTAEGTAAVSNGNGSNGGSATEMSIDTADGTARGTAGVASAALFKEVTYAREVLEELSLASGVLTGPAPLRSLLGRLLKELPSLVRAHGEMVRQATAGLASEVAISSLLIFPLPSLDNINDPEERAVAAELIDLITKATTFLEKLAADFDAATGVLYEHARARGTAGSAGISGMPSVEAGDTEILAAADAAINAVMERSRPEENAGGEEEESEEESEDEELTKEQAATVAAAISAALRGHGAGGPGPAEDAMDVEESLAASSHDATYQAAVTRIAFSVEWIVQLLASNVGCSSPWIVRILPSLLRLQELVPSELQFVALVARKALVAAKYQPFQPQEAAQVLSVLEHASHAELWPERAAALIFSQYFWFRHALLMGNQGTSKIMEMILQRFEDEKLEVRELSAATLSGLIRGLPPSEAASLRAKFLARALEVFPARSRRRRRDEADAPAVPAVAPLPVRHGAALALQALVLSSPYDVPLWLPDILMALVRLASEPAPIRGTVTKALGEFRRTHEEGSLVEMREALTAEQWEAIRDVAVPASYFV